MKSKTDQQTIKQLIRAAKDVREYAYAPYSNFAVGAAVLCAAPRQVGNKRENENIFTGCNVENVSLGLSICAERTAIVKAFSEGCRDIKAIAIVTDSKQPASPCGICRQFFYEFNPQMTVILSNLDGTIITKKAKDLLPLAFERKR